MNTTTQFSVIEVADLYGLNRQTVYKRIAKGELSKNSDGKIDLAEAIRVFGEPANRNKVATPAPPDNTDSSKEVDILKEQVDMLKEQLRMSMERERMAKEREEAALNRELFYQNQIEVAQRLLMPPEPPFSDNGSGNSNDEAGDTPKATQQVDNTASTVDTKLHEETPSGNDQSKTEQPKGGFWSKIFS